MYAQETMIAVGTGFPYIHQGKDALITAWHNISGRNPLTGQCLSPTAAIPDRLSVRSPILTTVEGATAVGWQTRRIDLVDDDDGPIVVAHPRLAEGVDIAAVRLTGWHEAGGALHVNAETLALADFELKVGGDVFIIGYPKNLVGFGSAPIWKRGTFASDPGYKIAGLPKSVIDTATRSGMSGAPVFARSEAFWFPAGVTDLSNAVFGTAWKFIGIYTGREGEDDSLAQLGIAWREDAIIELMESMG